MTQPAETGRRWPRRRRVLVGLGAALLVVLVVGVAAFLWWAQPQPLLPEATAALASPERADFTQGPDGRLTYTPTAHEPSVGLILYPGGKVPPAGYAPNARAIAEAGYLVAIVPVPINLAVFDIGLLERSNGQVAVLRYQTDDLDRLPTPASKRRV